MYNKIKFFLLLVFLFCFYYINAEKLQTGDLIFLLSGKSDFSKAISDATFRKDSLDLSHVGIIWVKDSTLSVIEASPEEGVRIIDFDNFTNGRDNYIVTRLIESAPFQQIIQSALCHIGEEYDWWYLPDNGKMYCSELIYECYLDVNGNHIFQAEPMNFRAEDGSMPDFWINLFKKIDSSIPEGILGTNPNSLFRSPYLRVVQK